MPQPKSKFEQAMVAPDQIFETPDQVVDNEQLSLDEKKKVLTAWRDSENQLVRASGEGMTGGESPHLQLVDDALARIEKAERGSSA